MKKPLVLISIPLLLISSGPARCQENDMIRKEAKIAVAPFATATQEQEAEIRKLIEDFVITDKENQTKAAEELRSEKAKTEAQQEANLHPDPDFGVIDPPDSYETPPSVLEKLQGYAKARTAAFKRLTAFNELAFPILASHLEDERPSSMHWNHTFVKTVGGICYRIIHDQLTEFPAGYTEYGYQRTGRDGKSHVKPYWDGTPYDAVGGLEKWLLQNKDLTYLEKRIKCLTWLLDEEKKIGGVDPHDYYVNILPLELAILELKAEAGQDVTEELTRVRELSKTKPANAVPKELLPDGPLPAIEEKHSQQETSTMLKSCPDGHTNLKDIPILYGTFPIMTRKPADWSDEDKALAKRLDANEVILGGELDCAEDPRFQPRCMTCGYYYKVMQAPDLGACWTKDGHKFADFSSPFSKVTLSLPFADREDLDISVEVNKKGLVVSETVERTVPADRKGEFLAKIEKWMDESGYQRSLLYNETPDYPRQDEQPLESGRAHFDIKIHTDPVKRTTRIRYFLERPEYLAPSDPE